MKIIQVEIKNFRNIKNQKFDLYDKTAIAGLNHIGKTNTLQAIYWVLCDSLMDNVKEFDSIIPNDDNRAIASVKLVFQGGMTFEKTYKEKWTKIRGENTERLTGRETNYFFNGTLQKTKGAAVQTLREILFDVDAKKIDKYEINIVKALVDPLYLFGQEDWKVARKFILSLVKIKTDEEIFQENERLLPIKADYDNNLKKTDSLMKYYKDRIKECNTNIENYSVLIEEYNKTITENAVSEEEIALANDEKLKYNNDLANIAHGNSSARKESINSEINALKTKAREIEDKLRDEQDKFYESIKARKDESYAKIDELNAKIRKVEADKSKLSLLLDNKGNLEEELKRLNAHADELRKNYFDEKKKEFTFERTYCPHCGKQLNADDEEDMKEIFENTKAKRLLEITNEGKQLNTKISEKFAALEKVESSIEELSAFDYDSDIAKLSEDIKTEREAIDSLPKYGDNPEYKKETNQEWRDLNDKISSLREEINNIDNADKSNIENLIAEYKESHKEVLEHFSEIEKKRIICASAQETLSEKTTKINKLNGELTKYEKLKLMLDDFIITKLNLINESAKEVFPDLEFVLVENNIQEGSFNEVCYPLIKGKKTPFIEGSNSERIMTGIAVVEDIRNALELSPLPIIFDEGETLDKNTLKQIETPCQIIYSMVDNTLEGDTPVAQQIA